jgi:hypothetical protein
VLFRRVLSREPTDAERAVVRRQLSQARAHYAAHPADADKLLAIGQGPVPAGVDRVDVAAHLLAASMLLNLDEAITHE